jgi:hypothetical protein
MKNPTGAVSMPDSVPCVIIPHDRFVEYQDRRRKKAAQPVDRDSARAIDDAIMSARPVAVLPEPPNEKQC